MDAESILPGNIFGTRCCSMYWHEFCLWHRPGFF